MGLNGLKAVCYTCISVPGSLFSFSLALTFLNIALSYSNRNVLPYTQQSTNEPITKNNYKTLPFPLPSLPPIPTIQKYFPFYIKTSPPQIFILNNNSPDIYTFAYPRPHLLFTKLINGRFGIWHPQLYKYNLNFTGKQTFFG